MCPNKQKHLIETREFFSSSPGFSDCLKSCFTSAEVKHQTFYACRCLMFRSVILWSLSLFPAWRLRRALLSTPSTSRNLVPEPAFCSTTCSLAAALVSHQCGRNRIGRTRKKLQHISKIPSVWTRMKMQRSSCISAQPMFFCHQLFGGSKVFGG